MIWIMLPVLCIVSEYGCYKFIKNLDKKERAKLQRWENVYVASKKDETDRFLEMQALKAEEKKKREEKERKEREKEAKKK